MKLTANYRARHIDQLPTMEQNTIAGFAGSHNQVVVAQNSERTREVPGEEAEPATMTTAMRPVIYIDGMPKLIETDKVAASPTLENPIDRSRFVELAVESGVHQTAWGHTATLGSPGAISSTEALDDSVEIHGNAEPNMQQVARDRAARDGISTPNPTVTERRLVSLCY